MIRKTMRWTLLTLLILLALLAASCVTPGPTHLGFTVGVVGAPPPPPAVVVEPAVVRVSGGAYVVTEPYVRYDMFRYGGLWYLYSEGYWYRSTSHHGPFAVLDVRQVPRPVLEVPSRHWKHHPHGGPPGLAGKKRRGR